MPAQRASRGGIAGADRRARQPGVKWLRRAQELFADVPRPDHFTDHEHCCECAEHDATLRNEFPDTLTHEKLPPGRDPFCFVTPAGFQYYFPALVRLALDGSGHEYFIDRLVFHLEFDGKRNPRYLRFTPEQRAYVVELLHHLVETRADEIEANFDTDALFRAIEVWEE